MFYYYCHPREQTQLKVKHEMQYFTTSTQTPPVIDQHRNRKALSCGLSMNSRRYCRNLLSFSASFSKECSAWTSDRAEPCSERVNRYFVHHGFQFGTFFPKRLRKGKNTWCPGEGLGRRPNVTIAASRLRAGGAIPASTSS